MFKYCISFCLIVISNFPFSQSNAEVCLTDVSTADLWGESDVWWHGRANFKGEVISPTCTIAMDSAYQSINLEGLPVRELQQVSFGPEKIFHIKLSHCELSDKRLLGNIYSNTQFSLSFDGLEGATPNQFSMVGSAQGIELQIIDSNGKEVEVNKKNASHFTLRQ
ncbi:fimbrial protein [Shewanella frigidimarina]|uniref:fimbrial protein n=1 Tax=Shewanella frigidimarina TaxID=56812 RepID=UPI00317800A2